MGNATTVCSDKTGTLTQNKMTVVAATLGKQSNRVSFGEAEQNKEDAAKASMGRNVPVTEFPGIISSGVKELLIQSNAVNSTAFEGDQDGENTFIGSKTEVALLTFCRDHLGADPVDQIRTSTPQTQVFPFDSKNKYSAVVIRLPNGHHRLFVKGASEILLGQCTKMLQDPTQDELTAAGLGKEDREACSDTIQAYAAQSLRTIGSSYRDFESWPPAGAANSQDPSQADFSLVHEDMTLIGIYGIKDPLRPSTIDAIKDCRKAGVVVRMVTGDNINTAIAIAGECGIYNKEEGGIAMEGPAFRRLSKEELKDTVQHLQVLARSSPEDKRILVRALKELGETVAVTGDGTNDAPALKMADIGFSMGIAGTEVAKEASSIILLDDK
jgi:Ca2+-transporting ATPase